jgi:cyclase
MKKYIIAILVLFISSHGVLSQDWASVTIKTHKINDKISVLEGRGGNIGVLAGDDGMMIIDAQYAELNAKISQALATISDKGIQFILNTHWHGDHVGGNALLAKDGAVILAQDNVRKRMTTEQFMEWVDRKVPPSPKAALPVITFQDQITFHLNNEEVYVFHSAPAHTDGDAVVWFKTSNVIHMGDLMVTYGFPYIDVSAGGMLDGLIEFQGDVLQQINDQTVVIPGHGAISSKSDLEKFRNQLIDIRAKIMPYVEAGKSIDEVIKENPIAEYDEIWPNGWVKSKDFLLLTYRGIKLAH